uniref:Uncharacterized protein n=1 Tax=Astyanax mexicanus TaxID=7994 RepID=A0A8B9KQC0_ASTMX
MCSMYIYTTERDLLFFTKNHKNCTTLHDGIRHCGTRRVNHGDESSEAQARRGEVHFICVEVWSKNPLSIKPY